MTPEDKKKAEAERKKLYRQRKKQESLATPASIAPELEEAFRKAKGNPEIRPMHPLADEPALLADSILNSYSKDFCNTNALLKHILAHLIRIEIALEGRK